MKTRDIGDHDLHRYLDQLVSDLLEKHDQTSRIALKCPDGSYAILEPSEIRWIDALRNYVRVNVGERQFVVRQPINEFEQRLGAGFVRIHRSTIVNSAMICAVTRRKHGDYAVVMDSGEQLNVSRSYKAGLESILASAGAFALPSAS